MQASFSITVISNSPQVGQFIPRDFFKLLLTDLISLSHQPPHHGERGAINFQLGAKGPKIAPICLLNALKVLALSEYMVEGKPLREINLRTAKTQSGKARESVISRWTPLTTAQVNNSR